MQQTKDKRSYDAIVIGSGASGGWAAKELCEQGVKTLVLERGRDVQHIKDYPSASKGMWEYPLKGAVPLKELEAYSDQRFLRADVMHWRIRDDEQPFVQEKPFRWFRGYHVGGKSLLWARATQRWSDWDFNGPARDDYAIDWPIRYRDLAPWYSHVEKFIGVAGKKDGLAHLPDSEVQPPFALTCVEELFKQSIKQHYGDSRQLIHSRCAHLTDPQPVHVEQGRAKCQNQAHCFRGCIYGGYFSSNASTLPWAQKTGNLTVRPDAIVHSIIYDENTQRASGVRIIDRHSKDLIEYYAKIIFVNASTINSNAILLNSKSARFPNGLGNDNGLLGKYLIWHNFRGKANAAFEGLQDKTVSGRRPGGAYIPNFRNLHKQETDFLRGYACGVSSGRGFDADYTSAIGPELTNTLLNPKYHRWYIATWMMGETIPQAHNHTRLHEKLVDQYGIPQIVLSCDWSDNDEKMLKDYKEQTEEMFTKAGFTDIEVRDTQSPPGADIHEMGGIRMGNDPENSLLNKWNQLHHCKNVFVTDGACMVSTGTQNPTLTFMALTARAANYAVQELKRRNL